MVRSEQPSNIGFYAPWLIDFHNRVEKYRPMHLDDIVGNEETIERLKVIAREGNMPHIIISVSF